MRWPRKGVDCLLLLNFFSLVKDFLPVIGDETPYAPIKSRQPQAFWLNRLSPTVFSLLWPWLCVHCFPRRNLKHITTALPVYVVPRSSPGNSTLFTFLFQYICTLPMHLTFNSKYCWIFKVIIILQIRHIFISNVLHVTPILKKKHKFVGPWIRCRKQSEGINHHRRHLRFNSNTNQ